MKRLVVLALVPAFALAACGGGDSAAETETEVEKKINPADGQHAAASVLRLEDFPTGWRATKPKDEKSALECFKPDLEGVVLTGRADSDNFEQGEVTTATSFAAVYEDEQDAGKVFAQVSDGRLADCVAEFLKDQSDADAKVTDATASRLAFPQLGDASDARQIVAEFETKEGFTPSAFLDMIAIRSGRTVSLLMFLDVLTAFSPDQEVELAKKVETRMATSNSS